VTKHRQCRKRKTNVKNANLDEYIKIEERNFYQFEKNVTEGKVSLFSTGLMTNVWAFIYGEFYKNIGDTLKKNWSLVPTPGLSLGNLDALKFVGLRPLKKKFKLFNASIEANSGNTKCTKEVKRTKFQGKLKAMPNTRGRNKKLM
jgi:putative N6-adenine-specific DNA methylase